MLFCLIVICLVKKLVEVDCWVGLLDFMIERIWVLVLLVLVVELGWVVDVFEFVLVELVWVLELVVLELVVVVLVFELLELVVLVLVLEVELVVLDELELVVVWVLMVEKLIFK